MRVSACIHLHISIVHVLLPPFSVRPRSQLAHIYIPPSLLAGRWYMHCARASTNATGIANVHDIAVPDPNMYALEIHCKILCMLYTWRFHKSVCIDYMKWSFK